LGGKNSSQGLWRELRRLKEMVNAINPKVLIEIDGGIKEENLLEVARAGADILVVGSGIFAYQDVQAQTRKLKNLLISSEAL
jgi:ribulose-phosphate 3-epimerase